MILSRRRRLGGSVTTGYMTSVINLMQSAETHGVSVSLNLLGRDSLISRARNTLTAQFMMMKEATHLMFIDADISFDPESVYRMMAFDGDVVGGMYPAKALCWTPPDKIAMQEPPQYRDAAICRANSAKAANLSGAGHSRPVSMPPAASMIDQAARDRTADPGAPRTRLFR